MNQFPELDKHQFQKVYGADYQMPEETPRIDNIIRALFMDKDSVIVELGAGQGHYTLPMARRLKDSGDNGLIFAFDFSRELITRLDETAEVFHLDNLVRACTFEDLGGLDSLPIQDEKADRVLAVNFLQYLDNPLPICREIARVLRPGGFVLLSDWSTAHDQVISNAGSSRLPLKEVTDCIEEVGLGPHVKIALDDYIWAVRAIKPIFLSE